MATLRSLKVNVVADTVGFQRGLNRASASLKRFAAQAIGITGGLMLFRSALESAAENDQAIARLNAVVKATGAAAGFSSQQIQGMAADLQKVTKFADDVTISAAAVLATFTQVKGDNFRDALPLIQDMATVLGTDLKAAAIQVGKALNDPIKGVTALRKSGVSFTQAQMDMIKSLVQTGQVAKAQQMILAELRKEFGGASAAEAKTLAGQWAQLKNEAGDLAEKVIGKLQPALTAIVKHARDLVAWVQQIDFKGPAADATQWAIGLGAAAIIAPKVVKIIGDIVKAINAWRKAQVGLLAMSGPAGWATIAVGAAIAFGAVYAMDQVLTSTAAAADINADAMQKDADAARELAEAAALTAQAEEDLIKGLQEQIATFGMTSREIEIYKAAQKGLNADVIATARALNSEITALEASKKAMEDSQAAAKKLADEGRSLMESLRTPAEQYAATIEGLNRLVRVGAIDWKTYGRAVMKAEKDLISAANVTAPTSPAAASKGTMAAEQRIEELRKAERVRVVQERMLAEAQKQTKTLDVIAQNTAPAPADPQGVQEAVF